jgi:glycosyltransferase involved in cell wall biosynthesis
MSGAASGGSCASEDYSHDLAAPHGFTGAAESPGTAHRGPCASPLRVLMLASYFPKPENPLMGNWALAQAQALRRNGVDLRVVSFTSWVPRVFAITKGARAYANCPAASSWDGLEAEYPRWLYYPVGPFRKLTERYPALLMKLAWLTARRALRKAVDTFRPQVIYAHHTGASGFLAAKLNQETGLPYIITDHDFDEVQSAQIWPQRRRLFEFVAGNAHTMIAVATRMEAELKKVSPRSRTATIQNGSDPLPAEIVGKPRPAELAGKTIIFSCGTFYRRKAVPALVEAFARIAQKYPEAILRIAGGGEERPLVEEAVRKHSLQNRVTLLGFLSHAQVMQEMVWSDMFALIGWDEPFATVYLEATAAGKPIVCCSDGGINDVIRNEVHGLTIPPRDTDAAAVALDRLCGDPELRKIMGRASAELFQSSLRWDSHATRMIEIFESAVATR